MTDQNLPVVITAEQLGSLPASLAKVVESRTEGRYPDGGGFYLVEKPWNMPENPSAVLIQDARSALPWAEDQCRPAAKEALAKWLNSLGVLCAGKMSAQDAAAKLQAYSAMLEVPASILTKTTLDEAAREFQWFPSYAEISQFLEAKAGAKHKIRDRLRAIANARPTPQEQAKVPWSQRTQEERDRFDAMVMAAIHKINAA